MEEETRKDLDEAVSKQDERIYEDSMREFVTEDTILIEYWRRDEGTDIGVFRTPDHEYIVIRAFKIGSRVRVSVDESIGGDSLAVEHFKDKHGEL